MASFPDGFAPPATQSPQPRYTREIARSTLCLSLAVCAAAPAARRRKPRATVGSLQRTLDLSSVLWIVTAADPKAIPEQMRTRLEVIELSGYTEQEKLHIAAQYLLKRPFE